jgi:hypothetical protein
MVETNFTKGEWYISHWESDEYYDLQVSTKEKTEANPCGYVCSLNLAYDDEDIDIVAEQKINRANAHLVVAAPKMYKFLDDLANGRGVDYPIEQLLKEARGE